MEKQIGNIPREIADIYQDFFNMMNQEHDLILTISEMDEIIHEAIKVKNNVALDDGSKGDDCFNCKGWG